MKAFLIELNENITFLISISGILHHYCPLVCCYHTANFFGVNKNWRIYYHLEACSLIM